VHDDILHELGWTEDEYEAGVRADPDTIELEEERPILLKKDGFSIITINKKDKDKSKEARNVFSHVSSKFFETMSQAQANFSVESVGVIVNTKLHEKYGDIKREFEKNGNPTTEEWGFHGTSKESISKIAETGFLHPDEFKKMKNNANKQKKGPKKRKTSRIVGRWILWKRHLFYKILRLCPLVCG